MVLVCCNVVFVIRDVGDVVYVIVGGFVLDGIVVVVVVVYCCHCCCASCCNVGVVVRVVVVYAVAECCVRVINVDHVGVAIDKCEVVVFFDGVDVLYISRC